jgi:hypothetical protein
MRWHRSQNTDLVAIGTPLILWNQVILAQPYTWQTNQLVQTNDMVCEANCATDSLCSTEKTLGQDFAKILEAFLGYAKSVRALPDIRKLRWTEPNMISACAQNRVSKQDQDWILYRFYCPSSLLGRECFRPKSNFNGLSGSCEEDWLNVPSYAAPWCRKVMTRGVRRPSDLME